MEKGTKKDRRTANPFYYFWRNMLARCHNKRHPKYKDYGGRGIKVCLRWLNFWNFVDDIKTLGERPSPEHSIGRKNNDGNYTLNNCRWETRSEQGRNRRSNVLITANGETLLQTEWARRRGVPRTRLYKRRKLGWTDEEIINTP